MQSRYHVAMEPELIEEEGVYQMYLVHEDNLGPLVATFRIREQAEAAARLCRQVSHNRASTALLRMRDLIEAEGLPYLEFPEEW